MKNLIPLIGILFLNLFTQISIAQCPNPSLCTFEHLSATIDINDIEQIDDVLYLATTGGLVSYDINTEAQVHYTTNNGLRSNYCIALAANSNGVLWIATIDGLCKFEDDCFFYEENPENDSPYRTSIDDILVDNQDRLWLCEDVWSGCRLQWYDETTETSNIIYACDGDQSTPEIIPKQIELGSDGRIWMIADSVGTDGPVSRRLTNFDPVSLIETVAVEDLSVEHYNTRLQISNSGNLLISNGSALYQLSADEMSAQFIYEVPNINFIESFVVLENDVSQEDIWFTLPFDENVYKNTTSTVMDLNSAIATKVFTLDGFILSATNEGVIRSLNQNIAETFIPNESSLQNNRVSEITSDNNENTWIAFRSSVEFPVMKYEIGTGTVEYFAVGNLQELDHISENNGVVYVHNGREIYQKQSNQPFEEIVLDLMNVNYFFTSNMIIVNEVIYVGIGVEEANSIFTYNLAKIENGQVTFLGETTEEVRKIALNNEGNIFVGTYDGLYLYNGVGVNIVLENVGIIDLDFDVVGDKLWMLRRDVEWFENHFYEYSVSDGLKEAVYFTNRSQNLDVNLTGNIWLSGSDIQATDGTNNVAGPLDVSDGLPMSQSNTIHVDDNENVFVGTNSGIMIYEDRDFINISDTDICLGETVSFSTDLQGAIEWQIVNFNEVVATSTAQSFDFTFDQAANYVVSLQTEINSCTQTDIKQIRVKPLATDLEIQPDYALCNETDSVQLRAGLSMQSYLWTFDGIVVSEKSRFYTAISGVYTVMVEDYCGNSATLTTTVGENLIVNIGLDCEESETSAILAASTQYEETAEHLWSTGENTPTIQISESGNYIVTVTLNGCTTSQFIDVEIPCDFISSTTEIESEPVVKVFPNPTSDKLFFESEKRFEKIKIHNVQGELLLIQPFSNEIDFGHFQNGIYFVSFLFEEKVVMKKVIKL